MSFAIRHKSLDTAISTILDKAEEDLSWSLYCAYTANSFAKPMSFAEFSKKDQSKDPEQESSGSGVNDGQMELLVKKSANMLNNFTPPQKER